MCTSLAPRPMTGVFGLGMRLCVCMCTTIENAVPHNRQQLATSVNSFIDQSNFVAMKTLSGHNKMNAHWVHKCSVKAKGLVHKGHARAKQ